MDPADPLAALGRVTGELVHDLANEVQVLEGWALLASAEAHQGVVPLTELQRVVEISSRLGFMLRDVLSTTTGEMISPEVVFDPHALTENSINERIRELSSLDVQLLSRVPAGTRVAGRASFWVRIVGNLLINGARFAYRRLRIHLATQREPDQTLWVVLRVEDDGPGVDPMDRERIFRPLERGVNGRTGLGLSSVAWSAAQLHGTVRYADDSSLGGAAFEVRVPAATAPGSPAPPMHPLSLAGIRILMVDDDASVRAAVSRLIQRTGAEVRDIDPVGMPEERLIDAILGALPDVILLDLHLGERGGLGIWRSLQERVPHLSSRVVFVTGVVPGDPSWDAAHATGQPVLGKPFDMRTLVRTLVDLRANG